MFDEIQLLNVPFNIVLDEGVGIVTCERVLRFLSGKRLVVRGIWREKPVVIKCFYHKRAKQHVAREVVGAHILQAAHILSPRLLYSGTAEKESMQVCIYEYIQSSKVMTQYVKSPHALTMALHVVGVLAQLHRAGIVQKDLHAGNFLLKGEYIYVLDPGTIVSQDKPVAFKRGLRDLAKILICFSIFDKETVKSFFKRYVELQQTCVKEKYLDVFFKIIDKQHKHDKKAFIKKMHRTCTRTQLEHSFLRRCVFERHYACDDLTLFLQDPEKFLVGHTAGCLKMGGTCSVFKATLNHRLVVIKRYNLKGFMHGFKRLFQKTRAAISWDGAHLFEFSNIDTPKPIAFFEYRFGFFKRQSYYVSEYIPGLSLDRYFEAQDSITPQVMSVVNKVIALLQTFARHRIYHGDMKANNFLLHEGTVYVLDLDAVRDYSSARKYKRFLRKDRTRFLKNWQALPLAKEVFACLNINE